MTKKNPTHVAHCRCGAVEVGAWGEPIIVNACYCDDCQAAAQRLATSAYLAPDGGTEFMLFRRDRIEYTCRRFKVHRLLIEAKGPGQSAAQELSNRFGISDLRCGCGPGEGR